MPFHADPNEKFPMGLLHRKFSNRKEKTVKKELTGIKGSKKVVKIRFLK